KPSNLNQAYRLQVVLQQKIKILSMGWLQVRVTRGNRWIRGGIIDHIRDKVVEVRTGDAHAVGRAEDRIRVQSELRLDTGKNVGVTVFGREGRSGGKVSVRVQNDYVTEQRIFGGLNAHSSLQPEPAEADCIHHVSRIDAFAGVKIIGEGSHGVKAACDLIELLVDVGENHGVSGGGMEVVVFVMGVVGQERV